MKLTSHCSLIHPLNSTGSQEQPSFVLVISFECFQDLAHRTNVRGKRSSASSTPENLRRATPSSFSNSSFGSRIPPHPIISLIQSRILVSPRLRSCDPFRLNFSSPRIFRGRAVPIPRRRLLVHLPGFVHSTPGPRVVDLVSPPEPDRRSHFGVATSPYRGERTNTLTPLIRYSLPFHPSPPAYSPGLPSTR